MEENLILPTKNGAQNAKPETYVSTSTVIKENKSKVSEPVTKKDNTATRSGKVGTKSLEILETFYCSPTYLYNIFLNPESLQAFTRNPCQMDSTVNGHFRLFNDHIEGTFTTIEPCSRLAFAWRTKNWPEGHYSHVILNFKGKESSTVLQLEQSQIPEDHFDTTEDGWRRHYFSAIKQTFGFGGKLF